jgi:hypothetical protein
MKKINNCVINYKLLDEWLIRSFGDNQSNDGAEAVSWL